MGLLMGLDLGSTSIKAVLYDYAGNCVSEGSSSIPLSYPDAKHPTWSVWEPDQIWNCIVISIRGALDGNSSGEDVEALAVTGFGMDGLPIGRDGNPLYPFISWHCSRTLPQCERFEEAVDAPALFAETGRKAMYIDSIYRMMWMRDNNPGIMDKTYKWLLIEDYVNFRLCGEIATDYSMGATTSALKPDTHTWSDKILKAAGISKEILPDPFLSGKVLGEVKPEVCEETGLPKGTRVVLGGHDYICAAFAAGVVDERMVLDITGTWEMLVRGCRKLELSPSFAEYGYYIEGHVAAGSHCICQSNVSGDMLEWFRRQLCGREEEQAKSKGVSVWELLMREAAKSSAGSGGCTFLPHFSGCNAPVYEPTSLGAFVGMHNRIERPDMLRAVLEGLTYKMREMVEAVAGKEPLPDKIIAAGGAVRNSLWMQMKADVAGIPILVPEMYEATPLGAAMLAGLGTGAYRNEAEAISAVQKSGSVYEPDMAMHARYTDLYGNVYKLLQNALTNVNANIYKRFIQGNK